MKRFIAIILLAILLTCLAGCNNYQDIVLSEAKTYEITSDIHSMYIRINAADIKIERGKEFSVVSNLKNLEVDEKTGTLTLKDLSKVKISNGLYNDAMLTIYVPEGKIFESINLATGAGRFTVDILHAETIDFTLGAGEVTVGSLFATKYADIEGGAGRITISDGALNNFDLEMGVGELNLTSALSGYCELEMGIGASKITLIGSVEDYRLDIEKGLGAISVDGSEVSDFGSSGNGRAEVEISGGIGAIDVDFSAPQ